MSWRRWLVTILIVAWIVTHPAETGNLIHQAMHALTVLGNST